MKKILFLAGSLLMLGFSGSSQAGLAVTAKGGTLGFGAELTASIVPFINARFGINGYDFGGNSTDADGIAYDADLDWSTKSAILDWHPFNGNFRLSAGIFQNDNEIRLTATPTTSQTIGGTTYTPGQIGTLNATMGFDSTARYVGIGWGNAVEKNKRLGINIDIGVLIQGSPEVSLGASSGLVSALDLQAEAAIIEDDVSEFDAYPVVSVGLSYRF